MQPISNNPTLKVMSWNLLASCLCNPMYFPYASADSLNSQKRILRIIQHIKNKDCDLLFLQEVDDNAYLYRNLEKLGYECMFNPKKFNYGSQGILLAYKVKKFDLVRYRLLEYSGEGDGWRTPLQMKGNNAMILQVRCRQTNRTLYLGNTHLYWDPKLQKIKYYQFTRLLMALQQSCNGHPIILAGDTNSTPNCNLIQLTKHHSPPILQSTQQPHQNFSELQAIYNEVKDKLPKLKSAFVDQQHKYTNAKSREIFRGMIDYVFYSEGLRVQATEELPEEGEFDKEVGLPSSVFPSDHLPLVCTFEWTVKE